MVVTRFLFSLIYITRRKWGIGSSLEKGWDSPGLIAPHRTRFEYYIEKRWDPPGPTEPDMGFHRRKEHGPVGCHRREELGRTGSHQVRIGIYARLVDLRTRFWVRKRFMLPAST